MEMLEKAADYAAILPEGELWKLLMADTQSNAAAVKVTRELQRRQERRR